MIKGIFNKSQISEFLFPIQIVGSILDPKDDGGIILNFDKETKSIAIFTKKQSLGTIIFIKYKDLINTFEVDDEKIGIIKISEFIKYFSVIEDENTEIEFKDNLFSIKDSDSEINFKTADISTINEASKNFKFSDWYGNIIIDDKFKKLNKAIKLLSNEDYIYIEGKDNKVSFTVRKSDLDNNKFKCAFDCTITKDFNLIIKKSLFQMATENKCKKINLKFAERFICVECETDFSTITFFVAKSNV